MSLCVRFRGFLSSIAKSNVTKSFMLKKLQYLMLMSEAPTNKIGTSEWTTSKDLEAALRIACSMLGSPLDKGK